MPSQYIGRKNIVVAFSKYTDKQGEEKTNWRTIGEIVQFQNEQGQLSEMVNLWNMPGANIRVFPPKDKQQAPQAQQTQQVAPTPPEAIPVVNVGVPAPQTPQAPVQTPQAGEIQVDQIPF